MSISLEHFRKNLFTATMCTIKYNNSHAIQFPITYTDNFNITTTKFVSLLQQFENNSTTIPGFNAELLQVFTNYFACLEQFTNTLFVMLHFYLETDAISDKGYLDFFKTQDYKNRLSNVLKLITTNDIPFKKTGLFNKIEEIARCRNYSIHGNLGKLKQVEKTTLPSNPLTINYEDVMEELNLIINIVEYFRYVLPNTDLMPHYTIFIGSAIFNKKLDELLYQVLIPYLNNILVKQGLVATRTYKKIEIEPLKPITSEIASKIELWIQIAPEPVYNYKMNETKTNYWVKYLHNIIGDNEPIEMRGKIQLPQYMLL